MSFKSRTLFSRQSVNRLNKKTYSTFQEMFFKHLCVIIFFNLFYSAYILLEGLKATKSTSLILPPIIILSLYRKYWIAFAHVRDIVQLHVPVTLNATMEHIRTASLLSVNNTTVFWIPKVSYEERETCVIWNWCFRTLKLKINQ